MKRILGAIRRADERYGMIKDGDRVCVGVSGGKDSLTLMYALSLYRRFSKARFSLQAVMLDLGLTNEDTSAVEAFARSIDVPFEVRKTQIGEIVFNVRKEPNPCSLCATLRRGALNNAALEYGCSKVALGHNRDDVLETFLLSLFFESRLSTFAPVTYLSRKKITQIRPMVFLPEKQILSTAKALKLPVMPACCPVANKTKRTEMKQLLESFAKIMPDAQERMIRAISEPDRYRLWDDPRLMRGDEIEEEAPGLCMGAGCAAMRESREKE
ncbi:MAG: ATP-binding protein [Bacillota bacterium]